MYHRQECTMLNFRLYSVTQFFGICMHIAMAKLFNPHWREMFSVVELTEQLIHTNYRHVDDLL